MKNGNIFMRVYLLVQPISINGNKLEYKSYMVTGKLFDSFEVNK
ncbi:MAG TPA: hypothetical protein PLZ15_02135 [Melioribacteraceae bacterium]|nr:hypothetical protein [Melioribacteraceae bacterium]